MPGMRARGPFRETHQSRIVCEEKTVIKSSVFCAWRGKPSVSAAHSPLAGVQRTGSRVPVPSPPPAGWVTSGQALPGAVGEAWEPQGKGISSLLAQQGGLSGTGSREIMGDKAWSASKRCTQSTVHGPDGGSAQHRPPQEGTQPSQGPRAAPPCCPVPTALVLRLGVRAAPLSLQSHPSPVLATPSRSHPRDQRTKVSPGRVPWSSQTPCKAGVAKPCRTGHVPTVVCAACEPTTLDSREVPVPGGKVPGLLQGFQIRGWQAGGDDRDRLSRQLRGITLHSS